MYPMCPHHMSQNVSLLHTGGSSGVEHCIWSVLVLPDGTMVSGDSSGGVQLWDGQHGTRLQAFTQHRADVLAVAASPDGNILFATGIDVQVSPVTPVPHGFANLFKHLRNRFAQLLCNSA